MAIQLTPEQSARIDEFVGGLEGIAKEVAAAYLTITNTPHCAPEVLGLLHRHGDQYRKVSDKIEQLRSELRLPYSALQPELQRRLSEQV